MGLSVHEIIGLRVKILNSFECIFVWSVKLHLASAGAVPVGKYFSLERSGRHFEPIKECLKAEP